MLNLTETVKQRILGQSSDSRSSDSAPGTAELAKQRVRAYFQALRDQVCEINSMKYETIYTS